MGNKLKELYKLALQPHYTCDDCWYSCPKSGECCNDSYEDNECICGADEHNEKAQKVYEELLSITIYK